MTRWFHTETLKELAILKHNIYRIKDPDVLDFFKICFSLTVRKASWQRNGAWKIHRISQYDREKFNPRPRYIFENITKSNMSKMNDLVVANPAGRAYPVLGDTRDLGSVLADMKAGCGKFNLVVTSPPYGDHKTTMAYGQFSRHSGHWLDLPDDQVMRVDKIGLGGKMYNDMDDLGSAALNVTLDKIHKNDVKLTREKTPCRDREAHAFFVDLDRCLGQIASRMALNSHACFVVANRTVRRVTVPTDVILTELGKKHGFNVKDVVYRDIPNKTMPSKNAPENVTNSAGNTMTRETILIMRC